MHIIDFSLHIYIRIHTELNNYVHISTHITIYTQLHKHMILWMFTADLKNIL